MDTLYLLCYCAAAIQLCFWGIIFQRIAWYNPQKFVTKHPTTNLSNPKNLNTSAQSTSFPAVSIVICARNEAANLQKNLESILTQDYPIYEVVVVNDDSSDETSEILATVKQQFPFLEVLTITEKKESGKKAALTLGIMAAKYDWLLLTDADCKPSSKYWIREMYRSAALTNSKIVLGYGPYNKAATCLSKWVQFETIYVAIQYLSFALWKQPYMGVGRNLFYQKSLFVDNHGFEKHKHLVSGDDDLFVNAVANGNNTTICLNKDAFMYSPSPKSWRELYRQKKRHYSSSSHYKPRHKYILGLLSLSHFCFYVTFFVIIGANVWNYGILMLFILRIFLLHLVFVKYLNKINNIVLLPYIWLADTLVLAYYLVFATTLIGNNQKKWK